MKVNWFFIFAWCCTFLFTGCTGPGEKKQSGLQSNDSNIVQGETYKKYMFDCAVLKQSAFKMDSIILRQTETNVQLANETIKAFTDFAYHCPSDSTTPVFLIKTAQVAQAVKNTPQAKLVLEKCINDYPNFINRPAAIFLLAQLYDEAAYLDNEEQAKLLYQKIIDEYPKSDWASSAKGAIKFIGKSDQQIIEELQKKK